MMDASFAPAGAAVAAPFMVTGGNGVDVVNVQATTVRTIVNVGLGADTINVSSNAPLNTGTLDDLNAILVAISGDSNLGDRQNISQSGNAAGDTVQVDGNASFVTYSGTAVEVGGLMFLPSFFGVVPISPLEVESIPLMLFRRSSRNGNHQRWGGR